MYVVEKVLRDEERHEAFVYCAGHRFRITLVDQASIGIEQGSDLSEEAYILLQQAEERLACIQKAFSFLSYGDLSKRRLTEKLRRSFPKELSEETADLMEERGYLNDVELAKRYAQSYYDLRSYGPMRIKQELYGKGFSAETIEQVLEAYLSLDHSEKIKELLEQKFPSADLTKTEIRRKASAWLNRYGYDWQSVSAVFDTLF